ncbi:cell surface saccharide synthesis protein [Halomonas sp. HAL1]|uniref:capsular polysaccharide export protein, LipB/KpsS family n=1 Tax=Halomonas sp. HAL1 TaxID=550984 RepID=UPI00022D3251|nr:cell surface saccharide synthesis protein [Halomonas sp. HAL1]EHA13543.1 cell surface saccharide synthesis protein [Halomonas sp. HAL1]WKV94281.1 hypothetical protein Q3Y66_06575 [Halomonas sp. HAL1]
MSKLTKLLKHPVMFFEDAVKNKKLREGKPKIFVVGFSTWKTYLRMYFSEYDLIFLPKDIKKSQFNSQYRKKILSLKESCQVFIWGFKAPEYILEFLREEKISTKFVEDGFVRSVQLGATKAPPMSLCLDSKTPYFDATRPSDLEDLLNNFDFSSKPELLDQAKEGIKLLLETGVSKYNNSQSVKIETIYGSKTQKRILVLGQVEDDASIQYGCDKKLTNNDVVRLAVEENQGAQVIYKPHPDVMSGHRAYQSNPKDVENIALVLKKDVPLANAFETVDHVYTITSLGGFEALLRGITVTTLGCPFYSGWGLTDDRQKNERRKRKLKINEIFSIAYLVYPRYFNVDTGSEVSFDYVVNILSNPSFEESIKTKSNALIKSERKEDENSTKNSNDESIKSAEIPLWYNNNPNSYLLVSDVPSKSVFLYMPWIAEHGNTLINKIKNDDIYQLLAFDLVKGGDPNELRRDILRFALNNPVLYRKMVARKLIPIKDKIAAFVFTFDWSPVMRIIASVCKELDIATILIPHESVFADRSKYYWCPKTNAMTPTVDLVLGWGQLQEEIFVERGYPSDRFIKVGAPKFDTYKNYSPMLSRKQYCALFGLNPERKIILFASQSLDSQFDVKIARDSQIRAVEDLYIASQKYGYQLVVRLPPSKDDILGEELTGKLIESNNAAIDDADCYFVNAEETIFHSDIVTSVNSTMLFEAILADTPSFSIKYIEFNQIWKKVGIPAISNIEGIENQLGIIEAGKHYIPEKGFEWASNMFGVGSFDGLAATRIKKVLKDIVNKERIVKLNKTPFEKILKNEKLDVIAIPSNDKIWLGVQKYLPDMLNARLKLNSSVGLASASSLSAVEAFFQWGIGDNDSKANQRIIAKALGKPIIIIEDGFIRSLDIGLSGEPTLSIIIDDLTSYYDATKPSRLETLLSSDSRLTIQQIERSKKIIHKIVSNRVSKYNHAPDLPLKIGKSDKRKILLLDQRFGDQSVASGLVDEKTFDRMLHDAIKLNPNAEIIIKQHPDAIKGGKSSYYNVEKLAFTKHMDNISTVNYDINPYALFDIVDEVYVGTSGMGFEALLAGKKVTCYGAPFYSNWGLTTDKIEVERRTKKRSLEEVFFYSYIALSKYYDPNIQQRCEIEDAIDYIASNK